MLRITVCITLILMATTAIGQELLDPIDAPAAEGDYEVFGYVRGEQGALLGMFVRMLTDLDLQGERIRARYNGEEVTGDWDDVDGAIAISFRPIDSDVRFVGVILSDRGVPVIRGHWSGVEDTGVFEAYKVE